MSDSTTFEVKVATAKFSAFGADLAALVESVGCDPSGGGGTPLGQAVPNVLQDLASGAKGEECLTLSFPTDESLQAFHAENADLASVHPGKVAVGCFWVACKHREGLYSVSFTSATRSISSLMKESGSVRATFCALAKHATDGKVQVTNEWHEVSELCGSIHLGGRDV